MKRIVSSALMILLALALLAPPGLAEEPAAQAAPSQEAASPEATGAESDQIVATTEAPDTYTVAKGDTLWDISERFFDTPWVWPKLWEQNRAIGNPHRIKPGMKLSLYLGMYALPQEPVAVVPAALPAPEPPKPPEPKLFHPTMEDIGYLSHDKAEVVGVVFGAQDPLKLTVGEGDKVFVRFGCVPGVGSRYRAVHISEDQVRHPVTGEPLGYKHTFPAVLEVVEVKEDVAVAAITDSYQEIAVGDGVVPWFPMPEAVELRHGGLRAEGRLVAAQDYRYRIGQGHLVFLDLGSGDGLAPGQVLGIWREQKVDEGVALSDLEATRLGEMVVVLVRPDTATALVTDSRTELSEGDVVRSEVESLDGQVPAR